MKTRLVGSLSHGHIAFGVVVFFVLGLSACKTRGARSDRLKDRDALGAQFSGAPDDGKTDPTVNQEDPSSNIQIVPNAAMCRFIDPSNTVTEVIPGSPAEVAIPISEYTRRPELLTASGADTSFNYTIFQRKDGSQKTLSWDPNAPGWYAVNYRATIQGIDSESCSITAVATSAPELRTMRGCFVPETLITMADGTKKQIQHIKLNDRVKNPLTGLSAIVIRVTTGPEADKGLFELGFRDGPKVVVTSKHPFLTRQGLKQAEELKVNDEIIVATGSYKKIDHLIQRAASPNQTVVNIAVTGQTFEASDHMIEADGIIAGDLFLQEKLDNQKRLQEGLVSSK
jgi:Fe2+ transport system protein FeoA